MAEAERATVVLGVNLDDLGDHRPGTGRRRERGRPVPVGRCRDSPRRRSGSGPGGSACARGTSRPPPAWRPASPYGTPVTLGLAALGGRGRGRAPGPRFRRAAGAPPRRRGPNRGRGRTCSAAWWTGGPDMVGAVRAAGYATSPSTSRGSAPGSLNRVLSIGESSEHATDRSPGEADLPRVAWSGSRCWPGWSAIRRGARTSAGPTSRSTRAGSSASWRGRRPRSRRPSSGSAGEGVGGGPARRRPGGLSSAAPGFAGPTGAPASRPRTPSGARRRRSPRGRRTGSGSLASTWQRSSLSPPWVVCMT